MTLRTLSSPLGQRLRRPAMAISSLIFAAALFILFHPLWLTPLAQFLVVETPLEPADIVVVLGGGGTHRLEQGLELRRQGYSISQKLIITGGELENSIFAEGTWAGLGRDYAMRRGVPPGDILLVDWTESTFDDALAIRSFMQQKGFTSAILVSDPFHMRRAMWVMGKVMPGFRLLASPSFGGPFNTTQWWTRERDFLSVTLEYVKMGLYLVRYGL